MFSVLITTWGCEKYVEACRASVAAAKAKCSSEVEVLEVNDGSGAWNARNELIRRAKGEWLCFVDGDDLVSPEWLTELENAVSRNPDADLITFRLAKFPDGVAPCVDSRRYRPFPAYWTACAYKRTVVPSEGCPHYLLHEDDLFLMRCLRRAKQVVDVDVPVYYYRRHCDSLSWQRPDMARFTGKIDFVREWFAELKTFTPKGTAVLHDLASAKRVVFWESMGGASLDIKKVCPCPWNEWFAGLDRLSSYADLLPVDGRLSLWLCRTFRWHWLSYVLFALRTRLRMKLLNVRPWYLR